MSAELAELLDAAALDRVPRAQLSAEHELSLDQAYAVQHALVERRLRRGETRVGVKLGFTSRAKAEQMGVSDVIIGQLTSGMAVPDGASITLADYLHPRVEPEVAFRLTRDAHGWTVDAVAAAVEIIDSRYRDFRFNLADVVADNTSAAGFVLGSWLPLPASVDERAVVLEIDGRAAETGSTRAILDDPLRAVAAAIRLAARYQIPLAEGAVLLAGAATPAVALTAGTRIAAGVAGLGRVGFTVSAGGQ